MIHYIKKIARFSNDKLTVVLCRMIFHDDDISSFNVALGKVTVPSLWEMSCFQHMRPNKSM